MRKAKYEKWSREKLVDEVCRLEDCKKYGLVWEDKPEDVALQCRVELPVLEQNEKRAINKAPDQPTNVIIEGDNFHALSVLNYTHPRKVDVIYIDPPYNTGAKDWKYNNRFVDINDTFRHSKWLSMMEKRLTLAKGLLKEDGVLICAIDENERDHLGLLLEEVFPDFESHCVTIVHNPRGVQGSNFSYTHEYAFFIFRKGLKVIGPRKIKDEDRDWSNLRNWGNESERADAKNCFYSVIVEKDKIVGFGNVLSVKKHPKAQTERHGNQYFVYPIDRNAVERKWRYARQSIEQVAHLLRAKKTAAGYEIEIGKDFGTVRTVWQDSRYDASVYGTQLVHALVPDTDFDFPKSIWTVYDCIAPILYTRKNALVLDFFAGSGTTGHALMVLNKEDEGTRRYILCTNNENRIAERVTYPRIKKTIEGHKDYLDITGIPSNVRYFKTAFVKKNAVSDDTRRELVSRSTEMICLKEGAFNKVADNKNFKIYRDATRSTGILFNLDAMQDFKKKIAALDLPASLYIFSLTSDTYDSDFTDLAVEHTLCPIPESILEVYRKLFG